MSPENYYIPRRYRLLGQSTKQPLSNFKPQKPRKYKQLLGLSLILVTYKKYKCKDPQAKSNAFFCHNILDNLFNNVVLYKWYLLNYFLD